MSPKNTQADISQNLPGRANFQYKVYRDGKAVELKELPCRVAVISNLAGNPDKALPKLKDRKFQEVTKEGFDGFMKRIGPEANIRVKNRLTADDSTIAVKLKFEKFVDLSPEHIVQQVPLLQDLLKKRKHLSALLARTDTNDRLADTLLKALGQQKTNQKPEPQTGQDEKEGANG